MRILLILIYAGLAFGQNWPQWRGPTQDGISTEKNLPLRWSKTENIVWPFCTPP